MIITRAPLRLTLGGGATDLPSYYRKYGGFNIAAAIDKYVYIAIHELFRPETILKYSEMEKVASIQDIRHPIIRSAFQTVKQSNYFLELSSMADIPAGTGLGSSSSFTAAILKALHIREKNNISHYELAEQACDIELNQLKAPIGKQDQYIAAFGGLTCLEFLPNDKVIVTPLRINHDQRDYLEDHLLLYFTGYSRSASSILQHLDDQAKEDNEEIVKSLHETKEIGLRSKNALEKGDFKEFARQMDVHWQIKRARAKVISNPHIDDWYDFAMKNGALGGKLIGAGGGGFLLFYTEDRDTLREKMVSTGLREVRFRFDFEGTKGVIQ